MLKEYGYTSKQDKVYLQCFDANELKRIKNELEPKMGMDLNLVQLIAYTDWNETQQKQADGKWVNYSYDWMFKPGAMAQIAQYADGIGPDYHMLVAEGSKPGAVKLTAMVKEAHASHLQVHPYTVRADQLPEYATNVNQLYDVLYNRAGVDGLFTDFPDKAVQFLGRETLKSRWRLRLTRRTNCCFVDTVLGVQRFRPGNNVCSMLFPRKIALPIFLLRYAFHSAGSAQGEASRRLPPVPPGSGQQNRRCAFLRLIPAGFGSGRGSVHAKHGPQPASMRAAPAFRERLSDFEAVNTGSFSSPGRQCVNGRSSEQ